MKAFRFLVLFVVSLAFLFSMSVISNVEAGIWPTSAATLCWRFTSDPPGYTLIGKLRSFPIGSSNYLLSGKLIMDGKIDEIVNGNAVVGTSNVLITLNIAGKDSESMTIGTWYMVLSGTTLNGNSEIITHHYDRMDQSIGTYYYTGSMTKIKCP